MPVALGLGVAGAGLGSAILGGISASNQEQSALQARQDALKQYLAINVPDPTQQQLILKQYQQTGYLDPAMQQAINQGPSAQGSIALDPNTRAAQMGALAKLSDISNSNGMDAQERAQTQGAINQVNANEQGQRGAILQNAAARGVGGSGASLAAELEAEQGGANTASSQALQAQANASQRALQALGQGSQLAGQIHAQDYGQALNAANAADAISNFNARNQNAAMAANTQAQNQAQAYNVQEGQNIANQNTGLSNAQQQYNRGLTQQQYNNQLALASGRSNAAGGVANQYQQNADRTGNMWSGIGSGLIGIGGNIYSNSQNNNGYRSLNPADQEKLQGVTDQAVQGLG